MLTYNGATYTWMGRELRKITNGSNTYNYKYNADGIRTSKTVNGTTTEFFLNGSQILAQKTGDSVMRFFYDSTGKRVGFANGTMLFYYLYNLQGDVIAIIRAATGQIVAKYSYDAWGKCTVTNAAGYAVGDKNPFRYRGYYYDTETGLYYLNSRYYNPEFGRFISADTPDVITVSPDSAFWDKNLFAYCDGNPVTRVDDCGEFWHFIAGAAVGGLISGISTAISGGSARDIVISAVGGALSGALSASGVGLMGQILGNAAISASSNIATQISDYYSGRRQTFNEKELVADTVWGGVSGVVSGAGATKEFGKKHMVNLGKQTLNKTTDAFVKHGAKAYLKEARIQTNFYVKSTISITKSMFNIKTALTTGANFARAFLNR